MGSDVTKIPTFQQVSADFRQTIELDGVLTTIRIVYNTRSAFFHLSVATEGGRIDGVKFVPGYPVLRYKKSFLPDLPGDFIVFKTDDSLEDEIVYDALGNGWDLFYLTAAEYDTWEDARGLE